ncbi:ComEC/Rec2 family competence protein [Spongiactinospora sp. TRM90649]|uniref:ComEC/Rec2 family competence protein n=1 Tax=Spongiactinospora sp. TRM90649 TaxID=3031114 RepID=UPI0023F85BA4|nr:ComEC/Rec2 family competence protein [Spongiactinospora sp. TRM90649]MDF5754092.1 ComEC/Rec2 family competence protein [Spongiactinospora sp. TRM90649]
MTAWVLLGWSAAGAAAVAGGALAAILIIVLRPEVTRRFPAHRPGGGWADGWGGTAVAVLGCTGAVAAAVGFRMHAVTTGPVADAARTGAVVVAEIVLTGDPRTYRSRNGGFPGERVAADAGVLAVEIAGRRHAVQVPIVVLGAGDGWQGLLPSQRLRVRGRLATADRSELVAAMLLARGRPQVLSGPHDVQRIAGALRAGLRSASDVLPPGQRGLLPGLVVGDVSRMDDKIKADFEAAGLSHLLAVSGANLAIVAGAAIALGRVSRLPLAARAVLAAAAMLAFTVVARPSPSVLRALLMGLVAALALGTGRTRDGAAALSATILLLILFDPSLARSYGFALSVCATAGILVLAPGWRDRLAVRLPSWLAEAIAVPAAAQAAVAPVLVVMSGAVSLAAMPANLLAGPAVAPATLLGFVAALVAPLHLEAASLLVRPAGVAVGWIIGVAEWAAGLPYGTVPWPGGLAGIGLLGASALVVVLVLRRPFGRWAAGALAAGALVAFLVVGPALAGWPPGRWLLVACDVGQGDALVVAAGPGRAVVVDTGLDSAGVDRCLRDLGVRQVPLIILTHPHADHVGGLAGVFRGRQVGAVAVAAGSSPATRRVSADIARYGVPERRVNVGDRWTFGPSALTVIGPVGGEPSAGLGEGSAVNNASVVVHVRWAAGSALLSGDIETEAQARLLGLGLPRADVLKVPHHGSARQDQAFLSAVGARAALISVGSDNGYGHPAPTTLSRLAWAGMRIYRTDRSGDLAVVATDDALAVLPRGKSP